MTRRPKLRPGVVVRKLTNRGESYVIVKEPDEQKYFKFEAWEHDLLVKIDGTRTLEDLARALAKEHPEQGAGLQFVTDYVDELRGMGLLERSDQERHLVMMDKVKDLRRRRFWNPRTSSLFLVQFQILDPDRFMDRLMPWIRWLWSPWCVLGWVAVFGIVLGFLLRHWDLYWEGFFQLLSFEGKTGADWLGLFVLVFFVSMWHELGHGFTCKRFGGEVHSVGFMIFFLQPAFYCNIDDSYLFPRLSHRLYCAFGGVYFELMVTSVCMAVWLLTPMEWWVHGAALAIVFFTGLSAILININPLIKLDGYYALMDWLDVPGLREESFEYLGGLFRKLFHLEVPARAISRRRRRIYLVYGGVALAYTILLLGLFATFLRNRFVSWFGPAGYILFLAVLAYMFRRPLRRLGAFVRHVSLDKRELLLSRRAGLLWGSGCLLALFLLTVPRFPTRVEGSFLADPGKRACVRAPVESVVREVLAREGQPVSEGQVLALLDCPELQAEAARARADLDLARSQAARAREEQDPASVRQSYVREREAQARADVLEERVASLTLRAPLAGVVATERLQDRIGKHLGPGEELCQVHDLRTVRLVVTLSEHDVEEVAEGTPVRVLPTAYPYRTLKSRVLAVAPATDAPDAERAPVDLVQRSQLVRAGIEVENADGLLRAGMTGRVQLLTRSRSVAGKLWRGAHRWAASVFW